MRDSKFGLNADNNLTDEGIFFLRLDVASGDQAGAHNLMLILIFKACECFALIIQSSRSPTQKLSASTRKPPSAYKIPQSITSGK